MLNNNTDDILIKIIPKLQAFICLVGIIYEDLYFLCCQLFYVLECIIIGTYLPSWHIPPKTQSPHLLPPCIITMFNFHEHKRVNDVLDSQLFYSKTGGYKLQLIVAANAWKGTHVSVGVWYCSCISQLSIHLIQFSHTSYKDIVQTTEYNNFVLE